MLERISLCVLGSVLFAGCVGGGEDDDAPQGIDLTCDVIASADFCWTQLVAEAYACTDGALSGTFNEDQSVCTYEDGVTIHFDSPVTEDSMSDDSYLWGITIKDASGGECMRFEERERGMSLTTASGTGDETIVGMVGIELECPNGDLYTTDNALELLECDSGVIPGFGVSTGFGLSWSLLGSPEGRTSLIDCDPAGDDS